jgi:uncharacterized OsmC-like protein
MPVTVYTSTVRIDHLGVPYNQAILPAETKPVLFGVHGAIADHYRITPDMAKPRAATLDYIVASAGGCLTGTFGGILAARKVELGPGGLTADVRGEIEREEDNVLVIKRIHVVYHLTTSADDREKVDRAYGLHSAKCPVYRSLTPGIVITTELDWREGT